MVDRTDWSRARGNSGFFYFFIFLSEEDYVYLLSKTKFMKHEETYIVIANGGYLKSPVVEKLTIGSEDEEAEDFENFKEYREYILDEVTNEFSQKWATAIIIPIQDVPSIMKELTGLISK